MKTVMWDIDDVLNPLMRAWFEQAWLPAHPDCPVRAYEGLVANPPHELLGVALNEYFASVDAFRLSGAYDELAPVSDVLAWFQRHGPGCRHLALTATPLLCADRSAAWVLRHFGRWIRMVAFVPSPRAQTDLPRYDDSKADFIRWLGEGDVVVEDNPACIQAVRTMGLAAVLMPQPWNGSRLALSESLAALTERIS